MHRIAARSMYRHITHIVFACRAHAQQGRFHAYLWCLKPQNKYDDPPAPHGQYADQCAAIEAGGVGRVIRTLLVETGATAAVPVGIFWFHPVTVAAASIETVGHAGHSLLHCADMVTADSREHMLETDAPIRNQL